MGSLLKDLSILKKFLFINFIVFIIIGILTIVYLKSIQPNLIKKKTSNHIKVIDNTINHIKRLKIEFNEDDIKYGPHSEYLVRKSQPGALTRPPHP